MVLMVIKQCVFYTRPPPRLRDCRYNGLHDEASSFAVGERRHTRVLSTGRRKRGLHRRTGEHSMAALLLATHACAAADSGLTRLSVGDM